MTCRSAGPLAAVFGAAANKWRVGPSEKTEWTFQSRRRLSDEFSAANQRAIRAGEGRRWTAGWGRYDRGAVTGQMSQTDEPPPGQVMTADRRNGAQPSQKS